MRYLPWAVSRARLCPLPHCPLRWHQVSTLRTFACLSSQTAVLYGSRLVLRLRIHSQTWRQSFTDCPVSASEADLS
eukprot:2006013-Prymnesium_polylepis.1